MGAVFGPTGIAGGLSLRAITAAAFFLGAFVSFCIDFSFIRTFNHAPAFGANPFSAP